MHANYERLADLTCASHERGRASSGISDRDITLARLYSHALRIHVIGAFHATRTALTNVSVSNLLCVVKMPAPVSGTMTYSGLSNNAIMRFNLGLEFSDLIRPDANLTTQKFGTLWKQFTHEKKFSVR